MRASFQKAQFFSAIAPHQLFGSRNEALEWCEDMLLDVSRGGRSLDA